MEIGKKFQSYQELMECKRKYEEENFIPMVTKHSRSIEAAQKRRLKKTVNYSPDLRYEHIVFECIHAGTHKSRSSGRRPQQSTYKMGCPCFITLTATKNGEHLEIKDANHNHNHTTSREQFKAYPKQRQDISDELKKEAIQLLQMKASKKMVREHLSRLTGKNIVLKDVHNMAAKAKRIQEEEELTIQNYHLNIEDPSQYDTLKKLKHLQMLTQIQTICEQLTEACAQMGLDQFLNAKEALKRFLRLVTQGKFVTVEEISVMHRKKEVSMNAAYEEIVKNLTASVATNDQSTDTEAFVDFNNEEVATEDIIEEQESVDISDQLAAEEMFQEQSYGEEQVLLQQKESEEILPEPKSAEHILAAANIIILKNPDADVVTNCESNQNPFGHEPEVPHNGADDLSQSLAENLASNIKRKHVLSASQIKIPNSSSETTNVEEKSTKTEHMKSIKRLKRDQVTDETELLRIKVLLDWLVGEDCRRNILENDYTANKNDLLSNSYNIFNSEEDIAIVQRYFERTAWSLVLKKLKASQKEAE